MPHDPVFDSTENRALLVVCARRTIRTAAIAGIVWGGINLALGFVTVRINPLNLGLVALALLMLATGVTALTKPSLHALLAEAFVSLLLLVWNIGITALNVRVGGTSHVNGHGFIFPLIAAVAFFQQYRKLGHLKEAIATMDKKTVAEASKVCKELFKARIKTSPDVAEASSRRCRIRFMKDSVFCAQRNLARAFHMSMANFQRSITDPKGKTIRVVVQHPLGKVTYAFDKKNSEKIRGWLGSPAASLN
ncbi:MAG: hypothetical protein WCE51_00895 [Chthoniobacterales bacterium]